MSDQREREPVVVARLGRSWGLRGELTVQLHTDWPEKRFAAGQELDLEWDDGRTGRVVVRSFRTGGRHALLALEGVDDVDAAKRLTSAWVLASPDSLPELEDGEVHHAQLAGLTVVTQGGDRVGTVLRVEEGVGQDAVLVRVEGQGAAREVLVPLVPAICTSIDTEAGRLAVNAPRGLL
ncbi:MAG: ribosome maturation factor RimM, partial [Acidobacteriota bacterium]|nr:ribosome maturation factor RimM [Acidobacteriota bacterium]